MRPSNPLGLFGALYGETQKPDPFRANEVPVDRGFLAPLATYADGQTELAMPAFPLGAIWDGVRSFGAMGFDTPEAIQHNAGAAFDTAGGIVQGGLGVGLAGGLADDAVRAAPKVAPKAYDLADPYITAELKRSQDLFKIAETGPKDQRGIARAYAQQALDNIERRQSSAQNQTSEPQDLFNQPDIFSTAQTQPMPLDGQQTRAFRGLQDAGRLFNTKGITKDQVPLWASSDAEIANTYAGTNDKSAVLPLDFRFQNPLEINANGSDFFGVNWNGIFGTENIAKAARGQDYDGVKFNNIMDQGFTDDIPPLSTTYAALRPGTVYSATTGDLLYSGAPTASSIPLAGETQDTDPAILEYLRLMSARQ
jgi:hypothetical protein